MEVTGSPLYQLKSSWILVSRKGYVQKYFSKTLTTFRKLFISLAQAFVHKKYGHFIIVPSYCTAFKASWSLRYFITVHEHTNLWS